LLDKKNRRLNKKKPENVNEMKYRVSRNVDYDYINRAIFHDSFTNGFSSLYTYFYIILH